MNVHVRQLLEKLSELCQLGWSGTKGGLTPRMLVLLQQLLDLDYCYLGLARGMIPSAIYKTLGADP
jgi:hypothetical protein